VEKSALKSVQNFRRIHENGAQDLQVTGICTEYSVFWCRILTTLFILQQ